MAKVIYMCNNRVLFSGTLAQCRAYKRAHYDRFSMIVPDAA